MKQIFFMFLFFWCIIFHFGTNNRKCKELLFPKPWLRDHGRYSFFTWSEPKTEWISAVPASPYILSQNHTPTHRYCCCCRRFNTRSHTYAPTNNLRLINAFICALWACILFRYNRWFCCKKSEIFHLNTHRVSSNTTPPPQHNTIE